jgi:hypothetical protein
VDTKHRRDDFTERFVPLVAADALVHAEPADMDEAVLAGAYWATNSLLAIAWGCDDDAGEKLVERGRDVVAVLEEIEGAWA